MRFEQVLIVQFEAELDFSRSLRRSDIAKARSSQDGSIVGVLRSGSGKQEVWVIEYIESFGAKLKAHLIVNRYVLLCGYVEVPCIWPFQAV
jgi:hypothetical protein